MAEPIELSTEPLREPVASCDTAISCLARLSAQNGGAARIEAARGSIDLAIESVSLSRLVKLAAEFGLQAQWIQLDWQGLKTTASAQPILVVRNDADVVVVTGGGRSGAERSASGIHITMASCSLCHAKISSGPGPDMR